MTARGDLPLGNRVTVVIPVWNRAHLVIEAIESVRSQEGVDWELIVVDDGSDDGSYEVVRQLAAHDQRITVVRRTNGGPSAARNTGVAAGHGRWVTFLDSDDLMPPGRIEEQVHHLCNLDQPAVLIGTQQIEIADGAPRSAHVEQLLAKPGPNHYPMSMLLGRQVFERVGGFAEDMRLDEDREFLFRCRRLGVRIETVDRMWTVRRIHGDNLVYDTEALEQARFESLRRNVGRTPA